MSSLARVIPIGNWSVATRIVVASVGIALVLAGATTAIGYVKASAGLAEQADARLNSDAAVVARTVDDWNAKHLELARSVAGLPILARALQAGDKAAPEDVASIQAILTALGAGSSDTTSVTVTAADGLTPYTSITRDARFLRATIFRSQSKARTLSLA